MIRLFVPGKLQDGVTIALGGDQAHYLRDVMRRSVGDEVLLFNAEDGEWRAIVAAVDRRSIALTPRGLARAWEEGPDLELIVAVIKRARLEAVVEKAVELGVRRIRLAVTRYTQGDRVKLERLGAIAIEAAEQTGRLDVPEILPPEKLGDILDAWTDRPLIFCDEGGDALPMDATLLPLRGEGTSILIGPEGGFSSEERDRLRSLAYVIPVSLGPRILRADTAAMAALVLWQSRLGDWSP
jgi:16S rRNA (uracil1498-N3)-methyltransferase